MFHVFKPLYKKSVLIAVFILSVLLTGCSGKNTNTGGKNSSDIDIDMTKMSSTMVYSEVLNIMQDPESYIGQKMRINGIAAEAVDEFDGKTYHACIIQDATACCSQGIEYVLDNEDYPAVETEIEVAGTFERYSIGEDIYYTLKDASVEKIG